MVYLRELSESEGGERQLSGEQHLLLLQGTQVQVLHPIRLQLQF